MTDTLFRIEAEDYKAGTNGVEFFDTIADNLGGVYRPDEPVDIQATNDVDGGFNVGWIKKNEYLTYDLPDVPAAGTYDIIVRVAAKKSGKSFTITVGGQSYTATFDSTGGNQVWQDVVVQGVALEAGPQELRIDMDTNGFNINYFEVVTGGPVVNTEPISNGIGDVSVVEGEADTVIPLFDIFDDAQDPDTSLTYTVVSNTNPGLVTTSTIDSADGQLTLDYTATGTGAADITVRATDTEGLFVEDTFTVTVNDPLANTAPTTSGIADVTVTEGVADTVVSVFDAFADAEDADIALTYTVINNTNSALVTPSTISSANGELTLDYAATGTGTADITVRATDSEGLFAEDTFTVTVSEPLANTAPTTSGIADVTVTEDVADTVISLFNAFADAEDADTALTYTVTNNTNPALVTPSTISSAAGELTLDYAATGTGTADITVRATDSEGLFVEDTFTVTVNEEAPPSLPGVDRRIEAEDYKAGINGVEFFDTNSENTGGAYRPDEPIDIQATQDTGGGFNIGWIKKGEFLTYNITENGLYDITVRVATGKSSRSLTLSTGGQSYTVTFDSTGGNQSWQDVVIPGVTLNAGQDLRLEANTGGFNLNYIDLISAGPDLEPPQAALDSLNLQLQIGSTSDALFTVSYSDNVAIESDTIDGQDIQVTTPDGTILVASLFNVTPAGDNASLLATYTIPAPTGGWQASDSGTYTVEILADEVKDTADNPLASEQFSLPVLVSDPPRKTYEYGIADIVVLEGASDSVVDLFEAFEDNQDPDSALQYSVTDNTNSNLVSTNIDDVGGTLNLDYATSGTGSADITVEATDTSTSSTDTPFTVTVVAPQADDGTIRINAGGGNVYDEEGNLFLADTYFTGGAVASISSGKGIANTKADAIYQTQRQGGSFSYSVPVPNGNYVLSAHIVDWESDDFNQRVFDITVEGQTFYDDLDIYSEIKNAFLDGQDTASIIKGPDKDTTIVTGVSDGSLDISFDASLNNAVIAAFEITPLDQPGVLIQETPVGNPSTTVSEDGMVDSYTVVLTAPPTTGSVTVDLSFDNAQISTNATNLTFDDVNWNQPQTINISAVDDALVEGPHIDLISHTVTAAPGSNYAGITTADNVTVNIIDNDSTGGGISFTHKIIDTPQGGTTVTFGPDGRLYVASVLGNITIYDLDDDYNIVGTETVDLISNFSNKNITGIAFNPFDTAPKIYVSHNQFYANGGKNGFPPTEFSPYSGQVSILEEINGTWQLTPLITGIGVSNHDHGVNGLAFDNDGALYITSGSNTNAGVSDIEIGGIDESPFTAAILKADITKPDFNGTIEYSLIDIPADLPGVTQEFLDSLPPEILNPPANLGFDPEDSQFWGGYVDVVPGVDVEVYASGLRNPYDVVFTTDGFLYATENNANGGFGSESTGPYTEEPFGNEQPEELNLIVEGAYYGHPNRNRGRTDSRQNIYFDSPVDLPAEGYTAPIGTFQGSTNGVVEYRATTFGGQLRGDLLAQKLKGKLFGVDLSADGQQVDEIIDLNNFATVTGDNTVISRGLDVTTGPGGAIVGIDFQRDELTVAIPNDPSITSPTAYDIYPWRAPAQSGATFIIGGVNFNDLDPGNLDTGDVRVFIGDQEATAIEATITGVSDKQIEGILPDLSSQPSQLLDLFIKDAAGGLISSIDDAFLPL